MPFHLIHYHLLKQVEFVSERQLLQHVVSMKLRRKKVAELILTTLTHPENEEVLNTVRQEVKQLTETFKLYA